MEALAVVDVLDRHGAVIHRDRLFSMPAIIGRGFESDVLLDDPHVAAQHLRLDVVEGGSFVLTDMGTHNGFSIPARSRQPDAGTTGICAGETIRLGHSQIRIWHPNSTVSDELPIGKTAKDRRWWSSVTWMVLALCLVGSSPWIELTGPNRNGVISMTLFGTAIGLLLWSGLWWLSTRSTQIAGSYLSHLFVAANTLCLATLGFIATNTAFFAFDLYRFGVSHVAEVVAGVLIALGVYRHLRLVSRKSRMVLGIVSIVVVTAVLVPITYTSKQDDLEKVGLLNIPTTLYPPWVRIANGVTPEEFVRLGTSKE